MDTDKIYIPPIKIQGIKTKLTPAIKHNVLMSHDTVWVEPFMGSGVVGFNIAAQNAIYSDTNPHIIAFYNAIKENKINTSITRAYLEAEGKLLSERGEAYYYTVRDRFNSEHRPLDFLFLNRSCFNGMVRFNRHGKFNVPYGHKPQRFAKAYITKVVNQVGHVENLLKSRNWVFLCQPFDKTISMAPDDSFIYCDPPYIDRHVDYYGGWNKDDEIKLHTCLSKFGGHYMVSTWDKSRFRQNEYINFVWGDCNKITKEHIYYVGAKEINRNSITEALLTNYEIANML